MYKHSALIMAAVMVLSGCGGGSDEGNGPAGAGKGDEAAVKGVEFLVKNQNPDGSFGGEKYANVGVTALASIAVSTTPKKLTKEDRDALDKAVAYIKKFVQSSGAIHNNTKGYEHYHTSLATMALLKIDPTGYKELISNARKYMLSSQHNEKNGGFTEDDLEYGGWRYGKEDADKEADPDLSNTQFVLGALHESGLPKDSKAFKRAVKFLSRCQNRSENEFKGKNISDDGSANYTPTESKVEGMITLPNGKKVLKGYGSMTYALLKSYIFCNVDKEDPRVQAAYKWIQDNYTLEENVNMGQQGLYYNYLTMARALQAYGSPTLKTPDGVEHKWAEELAAKLASLQQDDGSWVNEEDRWYESDKALVTSYAVWTLNICEQMAE